VPLARQVRLVLTAKTALLVPQALMARTEL
jgi:hypothetical protein